MSTPPAEQILEKILKCFDQPVMQNNLRGTYVEFMVSEILGGEWRRVGENWSAWDLQHSSGAKLEIKQAAAKQTWEPSSRGYTAPQFSIRTPSTYWTGAIPHKADGRLAHIYVFAWHGVVDETADQRDAEQWDFFMVPTHALPNQKTIALSKVRAFGTHAKSRHLAQVVNEMRMGIQA